MELLTVVSDKSPIFVYLGMKASTNMLYYFRYEQMRARLINIRDQKLEIVNCPG